MKHFETLFLEALCASLENRKLTWEFDLPEDEWQSIFALAQTHKVLPLVFDAVSVCPAIKRVDPQLLQRTRLQSVAMMIQQAQKTSEFLNIYSQFASQGIKPLVVKGLVCRELYPKPDLRISSDEDILVSAEQFEESVKILQECGLQANVLQADVENADEIGFVAVNGSSYIELHKSLFARTSEAYGELNHYFVDCFEKSVPLCVQGREIRTLEPGMHLFYLICHAFKHFLHSGFGIRQVCDMVMFANTYGKDLDWQTLLIQCREIRADKFAAAIFKIGKNYLTFDWERAGYPKEWQEIEIEEEELLMELLQSGIYGGSTMSRKHSAHITLETVSSKKTGKKSGNALLVAVFPPAKTLEGRYPYLKKRPYFLPIAWMSRLLRYQKEMKLMEHNTAAEALRIGNERTQLLKKYGIIE